MIFDLFNKNKDKDKSNVLPFPGPYVEPAKSVKEPEPKTLYSFGRTDDNRLTFSIGYATLTMNKHGVQQLIDQLEFFKNQMSKEQ
jgi:hypothetical protein